MRLTQVPPTDEDFSTMMKLRQLFRLMRSMAAHIPLIPAPMMRTAAEPWSLLPTGTSGQGLVPPMMRRRYIAI